MRSFQPLSLEIREGIMACWRENDEIKSAVRQRKQRKQKKRKSRGPACASKKAVRMVKE